MAKRKRTRGRRKSGAKKVATGVAKSDANKSPTAGRARPPAADLSDLALACDQPIAELVAAERPLVDATPESAMEQEVETIDLVGGPVDASLDVAAPATMPAPLSPTLSNPSSQTPRDKRLPARLAVSVRAVFEGVSRTDEVLNWSPGGVFVHTTDLLSVGDPVVLTFSSIGSTRPLSMTGRVRWVSPFGRADDPRPGMGIAFVGANESHKRRLATILRPASEERSSPRRQSP